MYFKTIVKWHFLISQHKHVSSFSSCCHIILFRSFPFLLLKTSRNVTKRTTFDLKDAFLTKVTKRKKCKIVILSTFLFTKWQKYTIFCFKCTDVFTLIIIYAIDHVFCAPFVYLSFLPNEITLTKHKQTSK